MSQPAPDAQHDDLDPHTPHKPADDREEVYFEGSPLIRGDLFKVGLWGILGLVLIVGPILLWLLTSSGGMPWWVNVPLIVLGLIALILPYLLVKRTRYRITNYRIDYERGLLSKAVDTLELWHVEDIRYYQSFFDRLFGVGNITIVSHDQTTPLLVIRGLPNPRPLFDSLKQRVIAVKRQRGVIKMDVG